MNASVVGPLIAVWVLACAITPPAAAQVERPNAPNGIKAGDARVHPYFEFEQRYDSAAAADPTVSPEYILQFRPGLRMELPTSLVNARLDANLDYLWYTGLLTPGSKKLSRLHASSNLMTSFNEAGTVEVQVSDLFTRSDRTQNPAFGIGVLSLFNELRVGTPIHPGGKALEVKPEMAWKMEFFLPYFTGCTGDATCDPALVAGTNYNNFEFNLGGRYKFLPKTALIGGITFDMRRHADRVTNPDVYLLHFDGGIAGLLTPRVTILGRVGWGQGLGTVRSGTMTAQAEAGYLLNETSSIKGGYLRTLEPVSSYGLFRNDRLYIDSRFLFMGKLTLHAGAALDWLTFYRRSDRSDRMVGMDLGPDYQFTRWLYAGLNYRLMVRVSDVVSSASLNFARHELMLRLTFTY